MARRAAAARKFFESNTIAQNLTKLTKWRSDANLLKKKLTKKLTKPNQAAGVKEKSA